MKRFNVTGSCITHKHYMVDISNKLNQIKALIDQEMYFTINRARQYGKTTTLNSLRNLIKDEYICIRLSFEGVGETMFESPKDFCQRFIWQIDEYIKRHYSTEVGLWLNESVTDFDLLGKHISNVTENKKVVLMIDEIDKTSNNRVFLHFLGMLREQYIMRENEGVSAFCSVILVGVHDIKNIKLKLNNEGLNTPFDNKEKIYNSPWNIAVDFKVDMSFNPDEIATMLSEYENDYKTGMDINELSQKIYNYTNGYPFLVSRICQYIDEEFHRDWTPNGVQNAVKIILKEENPLFDDLFKNMENNKELYNLIYNMLIVGHRRIYSNDNPVIKLGLIYGILKAGDQNDFLSINNKIFEVRICNYFITKDEGKTSNKLITDVLQNDIVNNNKFDMELCLKKFAQHYKEIFDKENADDIAFLERHGRMIFLSYLKPLINGQGFYHIESQFTDLRRMDIVVDFGKEQFIIELKIWHGNVHHTNAYEQLIGYLNSKNIKKGYLLTFDFRKKINKVKNAEWIEIEGKRIFDIVV